MTMFLLGALTAWTIISIVIMFYLDPDTGFGKNDKFGAWCLVCLPIAIVLFAVTLPYKVYQNIKNK